MEEAEFKERITRLKQVNEVVSELDPAIREAAFALLREYVLASPTGGVEDGSDAAGDGGQKEQPLPSDASEEELVERFESDKDAENALLCLAILLKRHGRGPYPKWNLMKDVAEHFGLDLPKRLNMTFKPLQRDGQLVFRKQADGWKITSSGEKWLKNTYGVSRGRTPIPS